MEDEVGMKVLKWALAGIGGLTVAAIIAVAALGGGVLQAEEPAGTAQGAAYDQALADRLGITVYELHAARQGALDDVLNAAVAAGKITPEQAEKIKEHPFAARRGLIRHAAGELRDSIADIFGAAAETIGISSDELKSELMDGKSLAQVAAEHNVTTTDLKAGIMAEVETQLDQAVASGRITQEQADKISAGLAERLDKIIEHEGGAGRPGLRNR
jgi:hypothetical protein